MYIKSCWEAEIIIIENLTKPGSLRRRNSFSVVSVKIHNGDGSHGQGNRICW